MSSIKHCPKGESPYSKLGHERIPYLPQAGEQVVVYAAAKGNYDDLHLLTNGIEKIYPKTEQRQNDEVHYAFELGSFDDKQVVSYQIVSAGEKISKYRFTVGKWIDISPSNVQVKDNNICLNFDSHFDDLYIRFNDGDIILSKDMDNSDSIKILSDGAYQFEDVNLGVNSNPFSLGIIKDGKVVISNLGLQAFVTDKVEKYKLIIESENQGIFGLGERFNGVNQVNKQPKNVVFEKFTQQGEITYFPIPFFYSTAGYGVLANSDGYIDYDISEEQIVMTMDLLDDIHIIPNGIDRAIQTYTKITGDCTLPPKWSFGTWISANRWNSQKHICEQIEYIEKHDYPTNAVVIEAWSDEATFYVFNDAEYEAKQGFLSADGITYCEDGLWPNPRKMIGKLHDMGIKVVLWQAPMIKLLEEGRYNEQQDIDRNEVVQKGLVIKNKDGSPYTIPQKYWFGGSFVPDFSNPETCKWVAGKRKYLMEMGIDGFKTDGGEFIYYDYLKAYNDDNGKGIRNDYSFQYEKAYTEMLNDDGVLFSRAGYKGAQQFPIHWAGDQQSLFSEMRDVIKAGLSLGLSGVPFWSFDIGGFANKLPTKELYLRWTLLAVFAPIFQWHSEPTFGQFADVIKGDGGINDRSPWNMADYHNDDSILELSSGFANMRMNFLPYIYQVAQDCAKNSKPMFKHLYYENPDDANTINIEDEFMLGDLLIAPIVHEGETKREIYLPKGRWENIFTGSVFDGKISIYEECNIDEISVFIKEGTAMMLNLNKDFKLCESVGNNVDNFINPCIYIAGKAGGYAYSGASVDCSVMWADNSVELINKSNKEVYILSAQNIKNMEQIGTTMFGLNTIGIYTKEG